MSLMLAQQKKYKELGHLKTEDTEKAEPTAIIPAAGGSIGNQQLALLLSNSLKEDLHQLHEIQSIQRKIEFKKNELLPKYKQYISRLEELNQDHELLGYYLVWLIDAQDWEEVFSFGFYCIENNISLPDRFKSDIKTFFVGELCNWAEAELLADKSADPYITHIFDVAMEQDWDLADAVTTKLYKCIGFQMEQNGKLKEAAEYLTKALDMGGQVKTRLKEINKKLN